MTIVDRSGTIVSRSVNAGDWNGRGSRGADIIQLTNDRREGIAEAKGVDGVSKQYGFTTFAGPRLAYLRGHSDSDGDETGEAAVPARDRRRSDHCDRAHCHRHHALAGHRASGCGSVACSRSRCRRRLPERHRRGAARDRPARGCLQHHAHPAGWNRSRSSGRSPNDCCWCRRRSAPALPASCTTTSARR